MGSFVDVKTTTDSRDAAEAIAATLTDNRLAACVQILGPIQSRYWWRGSLETAEEWVCVAKTREGLFPRVEAAIRRLHSYETAEIVATPIVAGSQEYLDWIVSETIEP